MNIDAIVKDAWILTTTDGASADFVYGTIVEDGFGRFEPGDWVSTSPIVVRHDNDDGTVILETFNTTYKILNVIESLAIPWKAVSYIRQGTPPKHAVELANVTFGQTKP